MRNKLNGFLLACMVLLGACVTQTIPVNTAGSSTDNNALLALPWYFGAQMYDHYYAYGWKVRLENKATGASRSFVLYSDRQRMIKLIKRLPAGSYEIFIKMVATGGQQKRQTASMNPWVLFSYRLVE